MNLERSIVNFEKKLDRLDPHLPTSHVPSSNNRTGLTHWKGRPIIALEDWIQIHVQLHSRLEYFPDDFDQSLTYMELPYYRYEFERKKRGLEAKKRSGGWLNDEVGYGPICHDSRGNLTDGLGNPIKEAEEAAISTEQQAQEMIAWSESMMIGRSMGIDVAWGDTSKFAIVITQLMQPEASGIQKLDIFFYYKLNLLKMLSISLEVVERQLPSEGQRDDIERDTVKIRVKEEEKYLPIAVVSSTTGGLESIIEIEGSGYERALD